MANEAYVSLDSILLLDAIKNSFDMLVLILVQLDFS